MKRKCLFERTKMQSWTFKQRMLLLTVLAFGNSILIKLEFAGIESLSIYLVVFF